ncbi:unnamed protein product [Cyclocybe aegerita]|uniref:Acyl-CoA dehydrogenase NM domain-like protein n=1 Tax=Cyclocybe aegerita TaxID=1973307 RepID=A0A8S0XL38_CYCAE|nr:unnamed protein product [Cyclocybe aegerita]
MPSERSISISSRTAQRSEKTLLRAVSILAFLLNASRVFRAVQQPSNHIAIMWISNELALSPLFRVRTELLPLEERSRISYERTKAVVQLYNLTTDDILQATPRYWELFTDPILGMDNAVGILVNIQYNMAAGTLARYAPDRPDIAHVLERVLNYELSGQYLMSEVAHGTNAIQMKTTATLMPDGSFELHTPSPDEAKFMPPTAPCGIPVVSVIFARLIVGSEDWGIKCFVITLSDGVQMSPGVECKVLPQRGGAHPVKHALTYFNHARIPASALLSKFDKAADPRDSYFNDITGVIRGGLCLGMMAVGAMHIVSYIGGEYSRRRHVIDASTQLPRPIISFSTQYIPILTAVAQTLVFDAYAREAVNLFSIAARNGNVFRQHFISSLFKTGAVRMAQANSLEVGERCGTQGLMEINQLSVIHGDLRGGAIADGDILTASIRFAVEVLIGRMKPPATLYPDGILSLHEQYMIEELRGIIQSGTSHRDPSVEKRILPFCEPLMAAMAYRMAYDAAMGDRLDSRIIDMFVASAVKLDPAWYAEKGGIPRMKQAQMQEAAACALLPDLPSFVERLEAKDYVTAPMLSSEGWNGFVDCLETLKHGVNPREDYERSLMSRL